MSRLFGESGSGIRIQKLFLLTKEKLTFQVQKLQNIPVLRVREVFARGATTATKEMGEKICFHTFL
jgi:tRNA U34 2-thiouridine synthase MnmA/TrmU